MFCNGLVCKVGIMIHVHRLFVSVYLHTSCFYDLSLSDVLRSVLMTKVDPLTHSFNKLLIKSVLEVLSNCFIDLYWIVYQNMILWAYCIMFSKCD